MSDRANGTSKANTMMGVAWYRADQWARLLEVSIDRAVLEATHAEWEAMAKSAMEELRASGVAARRVDVDVEALVRWCEAEGREVDAKARSHYAAELLRLSDQHLGGGKEKPGP